MGTARGEPIVATAFWRPEMFSAFPRVGPTETIIDALEDAEDYAAFVRALREV